LPSKLAELQREVLLRCERTPSNDGHTDLTVSQPLLLSSPKQIWNWM
jgi:hypothetical protein